MPAAFAGLVLFGCRDASDDALSGNPVASKSSHQTETEAGAAGRRARREQFEAEVTAVVDAVRLTVKPGEEAAVTLRLAGLDSPGEPFVNVAQENLADLVGQRVLVVEKTHDTSAREADIYLLEPGHAGIVESINLTLVRNGLARARDDAEDPRLKKAEAQARAREIGRWSP